MELDAKKLAVGGGLVAALGGYAAVDKFTVSEDELQVAKQECLGRIERLEDRLERHVEHANANLRVRNDERRRRESLGTEE